MTASVPSKLGMGLRWSLFSIALALLAGGVLSFIDYESGGDDNSRGATFCFVLLAGFVGIPSGISLVRARTALRKQSERDLLRGYLKSRDAISLADLSAALDQNEVHAEAAVLELIQRQEVDLVFHQDRNEYLHRGRIREAHTSVEKCDSCGAKVRPRVLFRGESASCEYCDAPLGVQAKP